MAGRASFRLTGSICLETNTVRRAVFLKLWAAAQNWAAKGLHLGREAFNRNREETLHFHFFFLNNVVFKSAREHHADTTQ